MFQQQREVATLQKQLADTELERDNKVKEVLQLRLRAVSAHKKQSAASGSAEVKQPAKEKTSSNTNVRSSKAGLRTNVKIVGSKKSLRKRTLLPSTAESPDEAGSEDEQATPQENSAIQETPLDVYGSLTSLPPKAWYFCSVILWQKHCEANPPAPINGGKEMIFAFPTDEAVESKRIEMEVKIWGFNHHRRSILWMWRCFEKQEDIDHKRVNLFESFKQSIKIVLVQFNITTSQQKTWAVFPIAKHHWTEKWIQLAWPQKDIYKRNLKHHLQAVWFKMQHNPLRRRTRWFNTRKCASSEDLWKSEKLLWKSVSGSIEGMHWKSDFAQRVEFSVHTYRLFRSVVQHSSRIVLHSLLKKTFLQIVLCHSSIVRTTTQRG